MITVASPDHEHTCVAEIGLSFVCMHFVFFSFFAFTLKKISRLFPLENTRDR